MVGFSSCRRSNEQVVVSDEFCHISEDAWKIEMVIPNRLKHFFQHFSGTSL
jgi:hypothetical protein